MLSSAPENIPGNCLVLPLLLAQAKKVSHTRNSSPFPAFHPQESVAGAVGWTMMCTGSLWCSCPA